MLVPVYVELDEGKTVMLGRVHLVGKSSDSEKVPLKGLKAKPRRAMLAHYDDVLCSP